MVEDLRRARQRLGMFLLRHGQVWRGGSAWTLAHARWLASRRFDDAALMSTFDNYRETVDTREATLRALEEDLAVWFDKAPFADAVLRLGAYRGITHLGGLVRRVANLATASDLVDRQFARHERDQLWVTDITEHPTQEGKVYCGVVLDTFSRAVVGRFTRQTRTHVCTSGACPFRRLLAGCGCRTAVFRRSASATSVRAAHQSRVGFGSPALPIVMIIRAEDGRSCLCAV